MNNIFVRFLLLFKLLIVFWSASSIAVQELNLSLASKGIDSKQLNLSINRKIKEFSGDFGINSNIEINDNNALRVTAVKTLSSKNIFHLSQYYKGIVIDGSSVSLVQSDNASSHLMGRYIEGIDRDIERFEQPSEFQLSDFKEWLENSYSQQSDSDISLEEYTNQAVIIINDDKTPQLAYKAMFKLVAKNHVSITRPVIYVDPYTQKVIKQSERTLYDRAAGSGPGGNPKTGKHQYNFVSGVIGKTAKSANTFIVKPNKDLVEGECNWLGFNCDDDYYVLNGTCSMDADGVQTINSEGTTSGDTIYTYDCDNTSNSGNENDMSEFTYNNWIDGYTPINDAHFHGQLVFEMYQGFSNANNTVLNDGYLKRGLAGGPLKGAPIKLRVHYDEFWGNANWDGTYVNIGDGYDEFYPMVSLDVISHEVAHGFMEKHNANFVYTDNAPSGSIAESFADIAGEAAEYFYTGSNDWQHNQEGFRGEADEAGRYFEDPTQDGKSLASLRDYWSGVTTRHGSGLFNKAFYHLVTDNAEWNTLTGYQLFMVAASNYWTGNVDFVDAAHGVVLAVEDLDTSKSSFNGASVTKLQAQVITAFAQVDIYTPSVHENYALLDYEINFNELSLINKSGTQANATDWQWSISREDGSDERTISIESGQEFKRQQIDLEKGIYRVTLSFMGNDSQIYQYSKKVEMGADYCAANVGSSITGYISQVSIDGQTVTGETAADNYADYSGSEYAPFQLASTTASITLTPSADSSRQSWSVWIDNNGDGDFLDEGEWLLKGHSSKEAITENIMIPNTPNVIKRLRVAQNYSGYPRPECAYIASGEVEDYSITLNEAPLVVEVNIVGTVAGVENPMAYSFRADTKNIETIETYEWVISDSLNQDVATYLSAEPTHTFSDTGDYNVLLVINDEYSASLDISVTDDTPKPSYCEPDITSPEAVYINRSFIYEANNSSYRTINSYVNGFSETGYQFNLNEFNGEVTHGGAPLRKGVSNIYYFELMEEEVKTRYWKVWVDGDKNNEFEDDEIIISESNNKGSLDLDYSLPSDYSVGDMRMRIRVSDSDEIGACDNSNVGEVEDYLISIE